MIWRYFRVSFIVTAIGLVLGGYVGWVYGGHVGAVVSTVATCAILSILEISLSFDNAVINANKLKDMSALWRRRFLTWGMLIAVFGMRLVFPVVIVAVVADIGLVEAVDLSLTRPADYAEIISNAHISIEAFGGTFLLMVGLNYFFNPTKDVHWIKGLEERIKRAADMRGIEIALVLLIITLFSGYFPDQDALTFQRAALWGLIVFLGLEALRHLFDSPAALSGASVARTGFSTFLYLEVLDSTFSFDGVIGAFALTNNLLIIAIGLGVGAMYVRSATIYLFETGTLVKYRYLEHGAYYAIIFLAVIMYIKTVTHVPEVLTGLGGVFLVAVAVFASVRYNRQGGSEVS